MPPVDLLRTTARKILFVGDGKGHGDIKRLMSPSDLGEHHKPFVFLDRFAGDMRILQNAMPLHPHSGIATVTVLTDGDVRFDDPKAGAGTLGYGGVEWLRAGGGVWHGKELSAGHSSLIGGFQLWLALPPELENGPVDSQYVPGDAIPRLGPAHLLLGVYDGASSPVRAPTGITYLLVRLQAHERWQYVPAAGQSVAWLAVGSGALRYPEAVTADQIAIFEPGEQPFEMQAGSDGATFVMGSAVPHRHDLHLGYYSVHTSPSALARGEAQIHALGAMLERAGDRRTVSGNVPVYR